MKLDISFVITSPFVIIISSFHLPIYIYFEFSQSHRRRVCVNVVEKLMTFGAVKHVAILTMRSAYCQYQGFLFLAAGNVLNVYGFLFLCISRVSELLLVEYHIQEIHV